MENNTHERYKPPIGSAFTLLPCPFCGSAQVVYTTYETDDGPREKVECLSCQASLAPDYTETRHQVQVLWNCRTPATCAGYDVQQLYKLTQMLQEREIEPADLHDILHNYDQGLQLARKAVQKELDAALNQLMLKYLPEKEREHGEK